MTVSDDVDLVASVCEWLLLLNLVLLCFRIMSAGLGIMVDGLSCHVPFCVSARTVIPTPVSVRMHAHT